MIIRVLLLSACILTALPAGAGSHPDVAVPQAGSEIERLIGEGASPALTEDGARVAYVDTSYQLWVVNRDGTGRRQLTSGQFDMNPAWSPDGQRIAFRRSRISDGSSFSDIWIMNADGTGQAALTDARAALGYYDRPAWSPDGSMLAMEAAVNGMMSEIYVIDVASGRFVNATRMNTGQHNHFDHQSPAWLADGERLIASRNDEQVIVNLQPILARLNGVPSPTGRAYVSAANSPCK